MKHLESDPFGQGFLEEISGTQKRTRDFRLRTIEEILLKVIPNLEQLQFKQDEITGSQILVSTHSEAMLSSKSIDANFLMLKPGQGGEATKIIPPSDADIEAMRSGLSAADLLLPQTAVTVQRI